MRTKHQKFYALLALANGLLAAPAADAARVVTPGQIPEISDFETIPKSSTRMDFTFANANPQLEGYYLEVRAAVPGGYTAIQWLPRTATTFSISGLTGGTNYCYYLRAYIGVGVNKQYAARMESCATTAPVPPTVTRWVDDDGAEAAAAGITGHYVTINAAITAASNGEVIGVLPGTYNESVNVNKSLTLQAMADANNLVNPFTLVNHESFPVVITPPLTPYKNSNNGIRVASGIGNVSIHGFYVLNTGFNGIQASGYVTPPNIQQLCADITIKGNRIEGIFEDGVKVSQCERVHVLHNTITNFDTRNTSEREHGIDFVAVGNSEVIGNRILSGGTGMTVKGGSINVKVLNNAFTGPFRWIGLSAGEPTSNQYAFYSSYSGAEPYQTRYLMARGNQFGNFANSNSIILWGCQDCTVTENQLVRNRVQVVTKNGNYTKNVCIDPGHALEIQFTPATEIHRENCTLTWPEAYSTLRATTGWDMY